MNSRFMLMTFVLAMIGIPRSLPAGMVAQESSAVATFEWPPSHSVKAIEIRSRHAAITVEAAPGNEVRLLAEGRHPERTAAGDRGQPPAPRLQIDERANTLLIHVRDDEEGSRVWITVPDSIPLRVQSSYAPIHVSGAQSDLELSTHSADIVAIDVSGSILTDTWSGNVDVTFRSVPSDGVSGFTTHSGRIVLTFPSAPDADVRFTTSRGSLRSAFALAERRPGDASDADRDRWQRTRNWRIGQGGLNLWFRTYSGDVELRSSAARNAIHGEDDDT